MKWQPIASIGGAICLGLGGILAATNPSPQDYESFATQQLADYLKVKVCPEVPALFNLQTECNRLVGSNQEVLRQLIAENTRQTNFLIFSFYTTNLSVASFLPSYRVETIGVFRQFHIIRAEQQ